MLFSSAYPLPGLIAWCRTLRQGIGAGLPLTRIFEQLSNKGPAPLQPAAARIHPRLQNGDSLEEALRAEPPGFPDIFIDLASVGERAGRMDDIFRELEDYFSLQLSMARKFRSEITWPVFQFFAAVVVIGLLIWVLGFIGGRPDFLDIALVYALINFIGTVAVLKLSHYGEFGASAAGTRGDDL